MPTISNNYVTRTYELGSVIAGTWKKFTDERHPHQGRIKCGTESNGGFRNITISSNVIEGSKGIALETLGRRIPEDIAITGNYDARYLRRAAVPSPGHFATVGRTRLCGLGQLRRVVISDIVSHNSNSTTSSIFSRCAVEPD